MKNISTFLENFKRLQKEFIEEGKLEFQVICKQFFEETPEITVVKWTQYTQHFNDGDPVYFSVHDPTFSNAANTRDVHVYGEYEGDTEGEWVWNFEYSYGDKPKFMAETEKNCKDFADLITDIDFRPIMSALFGDGVEVTVTKDGIDVEEYDHD